MSLFGTVFASAFAIAYLLAVEMNLALVTYHPAIGELDLGVQPPREGPAMYWYGWLAFAGLVALLAGLASRLVPSHLGEKLWPGWSWVVPLAGMLGFVWLLKGFFLR